MTFQDPTRYGDILHSHLSITSLLNEHLLRLVPQGTHSRNNWWILPGSPLLPSTQWRAGPPPAPTFGRLEAAARSWGALFPQGRHQVLQFLQSAQKLLDVRSSRAATGPAGDVDAVSEDDLVFLVHRVLLEAFPGLWWWGQVFLPAGRFQIHWTLGPHGQLDIVDVIKHHWLVFLWQGDIHPTLSLVPDDFLEDATFGRKGKQRQEEACQ